MYLRKRVCRCVVLKSTCSTSLNKEERWHFASKLMRQINICSVLGGSLIAARSFTARKTSYFDDCHMCFDLCCISLLRCVLLSTVQMLNVYSPLLLLDF